MKKIKKIIEKERVLQNRENLLEHNEQELIKIEEKITLLSNKSSNGNILRSLNSYKRKKTKKEKRILDLKKEISNIKFWLETDRIKREAEEEHQKLLDYYAIKGIMVEFEATKKYIIELSKDPRLSINEIVESALKGHHDKIFQKTGKISYRVGNDNYYNEFPNLLKGKLYQTHEHIGGRTNTVTYFYRAIIFGEINSVEEAVAWIHRYGAWIFTSAKFNNYIDAYQNADTLITAEKYIQLYSEISGAVITKEETEKLKYHFLSTTYGTEKFTQEDLVRLIIEKNC
jgi:hypothetical protein